MSRPEAPKPPAAIASKRVIPKPPAAIVSNAVTPKPPAAIASNALTPKPPAAKQAASAAQGRESVLQARKLVNFGPRGRQRTSHRYVLVPQPDGTYWLKDEETRMPVRPSGLYNFVRKEPKGSVYLSKIDGHPALADGDAVEYAGEIYFDDGRMRYWTNASGNYRPRPELMDQAGLPADKFMTYEDVMRGLARPKGRVMGADAKIPAPAGGFVTAPKTEKKQGKDKGRAG